MSAEREEKIHIIQFVFQEEEEAVKEKPKVKKSTKVKEKAHNYSMRTVCGGQIQVEESKTYSVRIIKAYIHEGIEYCSMIIEGTGDKECNWVPYKKFRFI